MLLEPTRALCKRSNPAQELCQTGEQRIEVSGVLLPQAFYGGPSGRAGGNIIWQVEVVLWGHETVALSRAHARPGWLGLWLFTGKERRPGSLSACSHWWEIMRVNKTDTWVKERYWETALIYPRKWQMGGQAFWPVPLLGQYSLVSNGWGVGGGFPAH